MCLLYRAEIKIMGFIIPLRIDLCRSQTKQTRIPGIVASSTWVLRTILGESPGNVIPAVEEVGNSTLLRM